MRLVACPHPLAAALIILWSKLDWVHNVHNLHLARHETAMAALRKEMQQAVFVVHNESWQYTMSVVNILPLPFLVKTTEAAMPQPLYFD